MHFLDNFNSLRLDIVGIVAILGEASTSKTARILSCSWWHALPRLMPAPQALLQHPRGGHLATEKGMVIAAYSGNMIRELNFFCQLVHSKPLKRCEVEFLIVRRHPGTEHRNPYEIRPWAGLWFLSLTGFAVVVVLIALSIHYNDGWALIGVLLLASTATLLGLASKWHLVFQTQTPSVQDIPDSDVVVYYPGPGAFRVVRCDELTHRMYFTMETVEQWLPEGLYRFVALSGTVTLMIGLICIGNAQQILQLTLAATYVLLNVVYWLASAQSFDSHWRLNYDYSVQEFCISDPPPDARIERMETGTMDAIVRETAGQSIRTDIEMQPTVRWQNSNLSAKGTSSGSKQRPGEFTKALWKVIALTGTSEWLLRSNIAPKNAAWEEWMRLAGEASKSDATICKPAYFRQNVLHLPDWPFQQELARLLRGMPESQRRRPVWSSQQLHKSRPDIVHTNSWWTPSTKTTRRLSQVRAGRH